MKLQAFAWRPTDASFIAFAACCIGAATIAAAVSVRVNRERACAWQESIAQAFCNPLAPGSSDETAALRARIQRDPGDSNAYAQLALADRSADKQRLIDMASVLAPRDPNLLLARASMAFERNDAAAAIPPLVELANYRALPQAPAALAQIVQAGYGALLVPYLKPGTQWMPRMLDQMRTTGASYSRALPLVVRAMQLGVIDAQTVRRYIRDLKSDSAWADAYALWLSLHGGSVPLLFNGSFDRAFEPDGFDWEVPFTGPARRAGAVVERRRAEQRGGVLDIQFTGRPIALPLVRQHLFIAPGRYRMKGNYSARQLRSDEGLAWTLRCGSRVAARSPGLVDTQALWRPFEFEFTIPLDCGLVAALQLETANAGEAALGVRGRAAFDRLTIEKTAP